LRTISFNSDISPWNRNPIDDSITAITNRDEFYHKCNSINNSLIKANNSCPTCKAKFKMLAVAARSKHPLSDQANDLGAASNSDLKDNHRGHGGSDSESSPEETEEIAMAMPRHLKVWKIM
jgi:hypothetical protein